MKSRAAKDFLNFGLLIAIVVTLNIVANYVYEIWDFTEEKRYTLTDSTQNLLKEVNEVVYVKVLLDGDLQDGFKRLRQSTLEVLKDFKSIHSRIEFDFEDPTAGGPEKSNARKEELAKNGIYPVNLRIAKGSELIEKLIYPYAIVNIGDRNIALNLLESKGQGISDEVALNNSVSLLEYKFANAIQKLYDPEKANILFTTGNGEFRDQQIATLDRSLKQNYNTGRINLDSVNMLGKDLDLLIIPSPRVAISQKSQFKIDQYIMNGGKVIMMIDYLNASLDSIGKYENFIPSAYPIGIEDMLFKYGVRIQPNLVLDLQSSKIPQVVGEAGGAPQTEQIVYFYHPLIAANSKHPIVKNIDRVNMFFPSTIDTIQTKAKIHKEILLSSSNYSRFQLAPMRLNFEILRYAPDESKFNKGPQPVAVLLEGQFESLFKNRVSARMEDMLNQLNESFRAESDPAKILVISDADFVKNLYNPSNNSTSELGFNKWERFTFKGNQQFIFNAIEYMLDDRGLIEARGKEVKLRLLDRVKVLNDRFYWQFLNIGFPILFLIFIGLLYTLVRKRRFGRKLS